MKGEERNFSTRLGTDGFPVGEDTFAPPQAGREQYSVAFVVRGAYPTRICPRFMYRRQLDIFIHSVSFTLSSVFCLLSSEILYHDIRNTKKCLCSTERRILLGFRI
jgi:hypothetical protein